MYDDYTNFRCGPCDRDFNSRQALYDHCKNAAVHWGQWCGRCARLFVSQAARKSHITDSSFHHVCWLCKLDYAGRDEYDEHMIKNHNQCLRCARRETSSQGLRRHMEVVHHYCSACERFFENENNLRQVGGGSTLRFARADSCFPPSQVS